MVFQQDFADQADTGFSLYVSERQLIKLPNHPEHIQIERNDIAALQIFLDDFNPFVHQFLRAAFDFFIRGNPVRHPHQGVAVTAGHNHTQQNLAAGDKARTVDIAADIHGNDRNVPHIALNQGPTQKSGIV